jgi:outer membrane protein assembly factor BamB
MTFRSMLKAKTWRSIGWVATVVCTACSRSALPTPNVPSEAVAYQIDPAHTGAQPNDTLTLPLTQRWSVQLPGEVSYPLIADGRVFVTVVAHTDGANLYALDQQTGDTLWGPTDISDSGYWSNAAYDGGTIFVINFNGLLRSFDAATGTPGWSTQLSGGDFSSPPTAVDGTVYVGGSGEVGTLYAVDETSGSVIWTQSVEGGDNSSPAVSSAGVYVSYGCGVYAFAPTTGASLWHNSYCVGGGGRTPALFGGHLYVRELGLGSVNAEIDAQTGAFVRSFTAGPIPAFSGSRGFFLDDTTPQAIDISNTLRAIDVSTGTTVWSFQSDGQLDSAPLVVGGNVYVGSASGMLYAVDTMTGATAWSTNVGSGISAPDEHNFNRPLTGLAAAAGALIVPAGDTVVAYW